MLTSWSVREHLGVDLASGGDVRDGWNGGSPGLRCGTGLGVVCLSSSLEGNGGGAVSVGCGELRSCSGSCGDIELPDGPAICPASTVVIDIELATNHDNSLSPEF